MKIVIGSDHAGFELKNLIKKNIEGSLDPKDIIDVGTDSKASVDYPDFANKLTDIITKNDSCFGILICGSGIGMSIAANRNPKARAALCTTEEMAELSRQHNDANILVLGSRLTDAKTANSIVSKFLNTKFAGGRHTERVKKLS